MKTASAALVAVLLLASANGAARAQTLYFSEAAFLAALSGPSVSEGFEGAVWGPSHSTGQASVLSQGITWTANNLVRTQSGGAWPRSGTYGIFDLDGTTLVDGLHTTGSTNLTAAGGWFNTLSSGVNMSIHVGGSNLGSLALDSNGGTHQFFGVIDGSGLGTVSFLSSNGHFGADDFTFTSAPAIPEPTTLALFGLGLAGAGVARRRNRKA